MIDDMKTNELFFVPTRRRNDGPLIQTHAKSETDKMKKPLQVSSEETAGTFTLEQFTEALQWLSLY